MICLLAALALLLSPVHAQPRCPDNKPAVFTGRPFTPFSCDRSSGALAAVELSSTSLPSLKGARANLDDLKGAWEGIVVRGAEHYQLKLEVAKGYAIRFEPRSMTTMIGHVFEAELKGGGLFGPKGKYDASVKVDGLPEAHEATVFVGAPFTPDKDGYDREVVLVYAGRGDSHRVRYKRDKDAVRFRYDYAPDGAPLTGELKLSAPKPKP